MGNITGKVLAKVAMKIVPLGAKLLAAFPGWFVRNGVTTILCVTIAAAGYHFWHDEHQSRVAAELEAKHQRALNDSTEIVMARDRVAHKKEIEGLVKAADEMNGKLIAALKLAVSQRDTTIIHDTLVTTVEANGVRTATFSDSTFAGRVAGTVTAPPYPAPLKLSFTLTRPAFNPEIGFVRVGNKNFATVVWQGESYKIESPFIDTRPAEPFFTPYGEALYDLSGSWSLGAGTELRLPWGLYGDTRLVQHIEPHATPQMQVGIRKKF